MMTLRPAAQRGHADHGWLRSAHSFSFGSYQDPQHMGFGNLRVINEDRVAPGMGFGTHGHRDMEIVSYVISGCLAHRDSLGSGSALRPGEVQRMSAGRGITHSEYNHSQDESTHFLQIWFLPDQPGGEPGYEQRLFDEASKRGRLCPIVSPDGRQGSLQMGADACLMVARLEGAEAVQYTPAPGRLTYVHLVQGALMVNDKRLSAGDALLVEDEPVLHLHRGQEAEVLVFDLRP